MDASKEIKTMKLYSDVERIYKELKELGYSTSDALKPEDVFKFDQLHYLGTAAVDESINRLGISSSHKVLDVGSGLGGPARYLGYKAGCHVEALELQADLNQTGEDLTKRCGLADKVLHKCGDFLKSDSPPGSFDFLVSWFVILHIPDKKAVYKNCFKLLKPGGKIYVEDYTRMKDLTQDEDNLLKSAIYAHNLPTQEEYIQLLTDAGFTDIKFEDLISEWRPVVTDRLSNFRSSEVKADRVRLFGQATYDNLEYFYSTIKDMLTGGQVGGGRIMATKPL